MKLENVEVLSQLSKKFEKYLNKKGIHKILFIVMDTLFYKHIAFLGKSQHAYNFPNSSLIICLQFA